MIGFVKSLKREVVLSSFLLLSLPIGIIISLWLEVPKNELLFYSLFFSLPLIMLLFINELPFLLVAYFLGGTGYHFGNVVDTNYFLIQYPIVFAMLIIFSSLISWCYGKNSYLKGIQRFILWWILFIVYSTLSLIWTLNLEYGIYKISCLLFDTLIALIGFSFIKPNDVAKIVKYLLLLFLVYSTIIFLSAIFYKGYSIFGFCKNVFGSIVLFSSFILISKFPFAKNKILLITLISLFSAGHRAGLVAFLLSTITLLPNKFFGLSALIIVYLLVHSPLHDKIYILYVYKCFEDFTFLVGNLSSILVAPEYILSKVSTISHRLAYVINFRFYDSFIKNMIGLGIGSFNYYWCKITGNLSSRLYPHNILIEIYSELGLIGIIIFIVSFLRLYTLIKNLFLKKLIICMFIYLVLTGSLEAFKVYLFFMLLPLAIDKGKQQFEIINHKNPGELSTNSRRCKYP